jgi:hypothetical protein
MPVKSLVFRYLENLKRGFFMESLRPFISFASGCIRNSRYAVADCSTQGKLNGPFLNQFTGEGSHQRPNTAYLLLDGETRGFSGSSSPST